MDKNREIVVPFLSGLAVDGDDGSTPDLFRRCFDRHEKHGCALATCKNLFERSPKEPEDIAWLHLSQLGRLLNLARLTRPANSHCKSSDSYLLIAQLIF